MRYFAAVIVMISFPLLVSAQAPVETGGPDLGLSFMPDYIFEGSNLDRWKIVGNAEWQANEGEITGTAKAGSGMLVLDESYQDIAIHTLFKCTAGCETGILMRIEESNDGKKGVFLSLNEDDVKPYRVTINNQGVIISRDRMEYAGGIYLRVAPSDDEGGGYQPPEGENSFPPRGNPDVDTPFKRPDTELRPGEWNQIEIFLDANIIRAFLNDGREIGGRVGSTSDEISGLDGFGPIALYVGGQGEVQFKDVMYKDVGVRVTPKEKSSPRFKVHRINDMYYSWGADADDFNQDGVTDVVAGPYIYYGPDYTHRREIFPAITGSPSNEFPYNRVQDTYDFNNDGWPDVISSAFSTTLFINPQGEHRRWKSYQILPDLRQGEITDLVDIDNDGIPELVYAGNGSIRYAKPQPGDPTQPWIEHQVSEDGYGLAHGIGTGDINGDGRMDILNAFGWWEQPDQIEEGKLWTYHSEKLGRYGRRATGVGGSIMAVYDANGDGLNDVITNLNAHGFGFAWYEQHRDDDGNISFTEHMISDDYSKEAAGEVIFSQPHGATYADIDQDGIKDFIVGKRYFTHLDNFYDPDPYSPPVLYWYKTVRDPEAPGGAKFVPELIHNRSGAGSEVTVEDINKDGSVDIVTSTNRGTFIYWNTSGN